MTLFTAVKMSTEQGLLLTQPGLDGEAVDEPPDDPLPRLFRHAGDAMSALGHYLCHNTARWRDYVIILLFECIVGLAVILSLVTAALGRVVLSLADLIIVEWFHVTRPNATETVVTHQDSLYGARVGQIAMSLLLLLLCYGVAAVYRRFVPYE